METVVSGDTNNPNAITVKPFSMPPGLPPPEKYLTGCLQIVEATPDNAPALAKISELGKNMEDLITAHYGPICASAHAIHKASVAARDAYLGPVQEARKHIAGLLARLAEAGGETPAGVAVKEKWIAVVFDAAAVPRDFCVPDQARLDALAAYDAPAIPGVRWEKSTTIAVTRRRPGRPRKGAPRVPAAATQGPETPP